MEQDSRPIAMPVFAGQKLAVVGGSSGMGRQTAADMVAAGGSAVIIGEDSAKVDGTVQALAKDGTAQRHHRRPGQHVGSRYYAALVNRSFVTFAVAVVRKPPAQEHRYLLTADPGETRAHG